MIEKSAILPIKENPFGDCRTHNTSGLLSHLIYLSIIASPPLLGHPSSSELMGSPKNGWDPNTSASKP